MEPPFNMLIVGMTNCGKTYYLLDMLEKGYKNVFEYIIIICPTFSWNKTYIDWKYLKDEDVIAVECEQDDVEEILKLASLIYRGTNSLIIVDDCAATQSVKNRVSELIKLAFSGRHYRLSTIVITQQLTSIAKPFRENISKMVCFYNSNINDMKTIFDSYLGRIGNRKSIMKQLKDKKYARLEISLRHPYKHIVYD